MTLSSPNEQRRFLFLQGPPSGFWGRLADALVADGHVVIKINFTLADRCFWGMRPCTTFRCRFTQWPTALERIVTAKTITDIVYYNDGLPYHQTASRLAEQIGIRAWCVEFGYLRPDWITLEPDGMNAASRFPKSLEDIARLARHGSSPDLRLMYPHTFATESIAEVSFNLIQSFGRPYSPHFVSGRNEIPLLEYLGWLPHLLFLKRDRQQAATVCDRIKRGDLDFFLVALQMEGDFQVRSSNYGGMVPFLEDVMGSFATAAPPNAQLIIKAHPLESGLRNWRARVSRLAKIHGISERFHFIRGSELDTLLHHVKGLIVLNSTVGVHGLLAGTPVFALGDPVYRFDELQGAQDLDRFWTEKTIPDPQHVALVLKALSLIQIKGSFYNRDGQRHAISELVARLTDAGPQAAHTLLPRQAANHRGSDQLT